jgi:hypothetical protein
LIFCKIAGSNFFRAALFSGAAFFCKFADTEKVYHEGLLEFKKKWLGTHGFMPKFEKAEQNC